MKKKTNSFLDKLIDTMVSQFLFEASTQTPPPEATPPTPDASGSPDIGIPDETGTAPTDPGGAMGDTGSPGGGMDAGGAPGGPEGSPSDPSQTPMDDMGGGMGGGGGGFIDSAGGGGGGGGGGMDSGGGSDGGSPEGGEEKEDDSIDPMEKFKSDYKLLVSKINDRDQIEKFLKASLQDKPEQERNEWLQSIEDDENPIIKKAKSNMVKFFK